MAVAVLQGLMVAMDYSEAVARGRWYLTGKVAGGDGI